MTPPLPGRRGLALALLACGALRANAQDCPPALPLTHAPIPGFDGYTVAWSAFDGSLDVQTAAGTGSIKVTHALAAGQGLFGSDALRLVSPGSALFPLDGFSTDTGTIELWIKPGPDTTSRQVLFSLEGRRSLNGDRYSDLIVGETTTVADAQAPDDSYVYFGTPNGLDTTLPAVFPTVAPRGIQAADLDADGDLDLVVASNLADSLPAPFSPQPGEVHIFDGPLLPGQVRTQPDQILEADKPQGVLVADFDQQLGLDVAVASFGNGSSPIWGFENQGDGSLQAAFGVLDPEFFSTAEGLAGGDVNHDGVLDMLFGSFSESPSYVMLGNLVGNQYSIPPAQAIERSNQTLGVSMADVNADGWLDAVLAQPLFDNGPGQVPGRVAIHLNDGMGGFRTSADATYVSARPFTLSAEHDLDQDGWLDVVVANWRDGLATTPESTVILGPLDGGLHGLRRFAVDDAVAVAVGDLDDDGIDDLFFHSATDSVSPIFLLDADGMGTAGTDGTGRFLPNQTLATTPSQGNLAGEGAGAMIAQVGGTTTYGTRFDRSNSFELYVLDDELHFEVHDRLGRLHQVVAPLPTAGHPGEVDGFHHVQAGWWGPAGLLELRIGLPDDPAHLYRTLAPTSWFVSDVANAFRVGGDAENQDAPAGWLVDDLRISNKRRSELDADSDGIQDGWDNCPTTFNPGQVDSNDDGLGNACVTCQEDLGFAGPGSVTIEICGFPLCPDSSARFRLFGAPPFALGMLFTSLSAMPTPLKGGTLVPLPFLLQLPITANATGRLDFSVPGGAFGLGTVEVYLQAGMLDAGQPQGAVFSNALRAVFQD